MRATIIVAALGVAAALWWAEALVSAPLPSTARARPPGAAGEPPVARAAPLAAAPARAAPAASRGPASVASAAGVVGVEARVREARRHGKGEQEVHRLRSADLPAAQVEALSRMEAAENSWRQRLEALQAACAANVGCDDARASFTREELARVTAYAPPTLRQ